MFFFENDTLNTLAALVLLLLLGLGAVEYIIYDKGERVATYLILAERDLNNLLASGLAHGGRKERVDERAEWNKLVGDPGLQVLNKGYQTVAQTLIEANEKELTGKGAAMGKASITAFLLRELYAGNVKAAQIKIIAETRNSAEGKPPYIAPGIDKLVGFDKFDPKALMFEKGAGVDKYLLRRVVRDWKFPRDIRWVKTDSATGRKSFYEPMDALAQLYQQNI